jgi:tRNA (adenine22-N1)-methyltransferase
MKRLSKRLQAIYDFVPQGAVVADVGADHAFLTLALLERGKISWAQAIENKPGPFISMKSNIDSSPFSSHVICSHSDGLSDLAPNVDCLVIAGMGGRLAYDILEKGKEKLDGIETIILDPHRDLSYVREKVVALGYHIEDEAMVLEDKIFYSIILFKKGYPKKSYTKAELGLGPVLLKKKDPIFISFCLDSQRKVGRILDKKLSEEKRSEYLNLYRLLKKVIGDGGQSEER